jgi:hypothetical protein
VTLDDAWHLDGDAELLFRLWYRTQSSDERYPISEEIFNYKNLEHRTWTGILPEMSILEAEIYGLTGEPTLVLNNVAVVLPEIVIIPPEFELTVSSGHIMKENPTII